MPKKILAILLSLLLVLSMTACGKEENSDAGYYVMTAMTMGGVTVEGDDLQEFAGDTEMYLELKEDGTGTLCFGDAAGDITWKPGEITSDGETAEYTIKGDVLTLEVEGVTMEFTRGKKGSGGLNTSKFSAADQDDDEDEEEIDAPKPDSDGAETITIGDHTAVFKGYRLTKDDEGRDAMVLTYDYTNGGEEEQSFAWAFFYEATQDGESLPSPWYEENGEQMVENYEEKVQPGETLEVKIAIGLVNTSDEVTIVFSDLMDEETCTQTIQLPGGGTSKPDEEPDGPTMQADDAWRGDWYGWWIITYASGSWEETEGSWSDCCATVTRDGDAGDITIWDEVFTKDAPLVECQVSFGPGTTAAGAMMSEDGLFIDGPIAHADWIIDPGASAVSQYERMLEIEGTYEDPEEEGAGFDYVIYLRPWGMDWEDVAAADESLLPAYYTDWYLPLIEAGEPMPDTIGD